MESTARSKAEQTFLENRSKRNEERLRKKNNISDQKNFEISKIHQNLSEIDNQISKLEQSQNILATSAQRNLFEAKLDGIRILIRKVEEEFSSELASGGEGDITVSYNEKQVKNQLRDLYAKVNQLRASRIPKKRFRFKNRARMCNSAGATTSLELDHGNYFDGRNNMSDFEMNSTAVSISTNQYSKVDNTNDIAHEGNEKDHIWMKDRSCKEEESAKSEGLSHFQEISDRSNCPIDFCCTKDHDLEVDGSLPVAQHEEANIKNENMHFRLCNLTNCVVTLRSIFGAIRMQNLQECSIYCGPVRGPVYVEGCQNCKIFVAAQQLRIHETFNVDFFVHVVSGPVIENCNRVRFGDYKVMSYIGLDQQMKLAGDGLADAVNCYSDVKDFKWHRIQKSPNWNLIEGEALPTSTSPLITIKNNRKEQEVEEKINSGHDDSDDEL